MDPARGFERRVTAESLEYETDGAIKPIEITKAGVKARKPPSR